jgi:hypothetical protein
MVPLLYWSKLTSCRVSPSETRGLIPKVLETKETGQPIDRQTLTDFYPES